MTALLALRQKLNGASARTRAVGMYFATSVAARGVGIGCQLLQVPIAIKALGPEAFGLWMTLMGAASMMIFADFGLGQGAQNRLAVELARGNDEEARRLWESALLFLVAVGALVFGAAAGGISAFDPVTLFNLRDPAVREQARDAMLVAALVFSLNIPAGLCQRLALARQCGWIHKVAQGAGSVLGQAGTVVAALAHWPLGRFIAAAQGPLVVANVVLLLIQLRQLGWWRRPRFDGVTRRIRELLGIGAFFGVQQIQLVLALALPQVIISTALGAAAVTPYNLAQRVFNLFAILQNAFMLPLWPAYSEAGARGEFGWIRRTLRRSLRATLLCSVLPMVAGAVMLRPAVAFWLGGSRDLPSATLVWLLFAWNAAAFLQQPFGYLLAGLSVVRRQTFFAVVGAALTAALMALLVHPLGSNGVVLGLIVGFLPFLMFGNILEVRRVLRNLPASDVDHPEPWRRAAIAGLA